MASSEFIDVSVLGLDELEARLLQLAPDLAERAMLNALKAGGNVLAVEVEARAPRLSGEMASHVLMQAQIAGTVDSGVARIGVKYTGKKAKKPRRKGRGEPSTEDPGVYAQWVEFGRKGMSPRPFMRPALDTASQAAIDAFAATIAAALPEVVNK